MKEIKRDRHLKQLIDSQPNGFITMILNSFRHIDNADNHIMPRRNEEGILTIGLFDFLLKENSLDI